MKQVKDKRVLLGITGGIAAYKSAEIVRLLIKAGCEVRVVMTAAAQEFITPLTMQALSGNPVMTDLLDADAEAGMGHIELARWAQMIVVAPASADHLAKLVHGRADDLLSTLILASAAPLLIAPAMNQQMWANVATTHNLNLLRTRGVAIVGPAAGEQACGDVGLGRLAEPADIVMAVVDGDSVAANSSLQQRRVVITAGPTFEAIDPVRGITNRSSGKMGFAMAVASREAGAEVVLIAGPVSLPTPWGVGRVDVESAQDMHKAVMSAVSDADLFISVAAVADYRPVHLAEQKIKKDGNDQSIELTPNVDILSCVAALDDGPFCVGFAAETQAVNSYAREKLQRKGLQLIVANDVSGANTAFNADDNAVTVIGADNEWPIARADKFQIARATVALIAEQLAKS